MRLWQVRLSYAVFGVITDALGVVVEAAPVGRWMVGKSIDVVRRWVASKRGDVVDLGPTRSPADVATAEAPDRAR